jgi:multiple sugar transport system substrate-binding protein
MKSKKNVLLFAVLLVLFAVTGVFAGGGKESGQKVLNFWYWDQNGTASYEQLFSEFAAQNPGVKVNLVISPWADYWTKLQTALPTGTGPDVFWLNHPNAVSYLPTGLVMDLEAAAGDIHFENFDKNFYTPFIHEGKRYGVPVFWDATMLFYNKALFDKAGIPYPAADWTWTDLINAAEKLTIKEGNRTLQYGIAIDYSAQSGFSNFVLQNGGKLFSDDRMRSVINSPEGREAMQVQLDMIHKYGYAPTIQVLQETTKSTLFQSGTVAMVTHHTGILKQWAEILEKNLGIAPLPRQKQRASIYHNLAYVASSKTKYPEETKKLLAFLASKRHSDVLSKVWATCYNGGTDQFYSVYNWLDTKYISEAITYGYPLPIAGRNAGAVYTLAENEITKIMQTPQVGDSLAAYEKTLNDAISR